MSHSQKIRETYYQNQNGSTDICYISRLLEYASGDFIGTDQGTRILIEEEEDEEDDDETSHDKDNGKDESEKMPTNDFFVNSVDKSCSITKKQDIIPTYFSDNDKRVNDHLSQEIEGAVDNNKAYVYELNNEEKIVKKTCRHRGRQ